MRISSLRTIMTWTYCFWYFLFNSSTEITSLNVFIERSVFIVCSWSMITIYFRIFSSISTYIRFSYSRFSMLISLFMTILAWPQCSYNIRFSFFTNTYVIQIVSKVSMFFMCSRSIIWVKKWIFSSTMTEILFLYFGPRQ